MSEQERAEVSKGERGRKQKGRKRARNNSSARNSRAFLVYKNFYELLLLVFIHARIILHLEVRSCKVYCFHGVSPSIPIFIQLNIEIIHAKIRKGNRCFE